METISVNKKAVEDLIKLKEEFDSIVESLELASDPELMKSLKRSKEQIAVTISKISYLYVTNYRDHRLNLKQKTKR